MKNLIFLIIMIAALYQGAQSQEASGFDVKLTYDETWKSYKPIVVPNATTATDSVWYYTFLKESKGPLLYDIKLVLDSVGGAAKVTTIILQTKTWESDSYTNLTTKTWTTGKDTVITFTNIAASTLSGEFAADSTMVFTGSAVPRISRYYRVFVRNNLKGFIVKVPELSILFKEQ